MESYKPQTEAEWMELLKQTMLERDEVIKELVSLNLWSARRLPKVHKKFAYDELDTITGIENERC